MAINFLSENITFELLEEEKVRNWIKTIITKEKCKVGNLTYLFSNDDYVHEVNLKFLNHDTFTDIITFDYVESNVIAGDILISVDRVRDNAQQFNTSFEHELHRVIIHGVLHLLGQGDKSESEAKEMRNKEESALTLWQQMYAE